MNERAWDVDEERILRFSGPGPRYTSYPTVPVWSEEVGEEEARAAYARAARAPADPLSLYVHIPFCERRCLFCGCTVEITRRQDRVEAYLDALDVEIERVAALLGERRHVSQLHWGGGTPTHLSSEQLRRVHRSIFERFELAPGAEVSIEVHPHVTTLEQADTLLELGFNRVSMGVQDVDPTVQKIVHRDQTLEETRSLTEHLRAGGVEGVNYDLMYGLPAQTEATFAATLDAVGELLPDRLAIYGYAHVPWLKKTQTALEKHGLPGPIERARLFHIAVQRLGRLGYEVIGLDHFALESDALSASLRDGTLHRNFMGYTTQRAADMISFGPSAISDVAGTFLQNLRESQPWGAAIAAGRMPLEKGFVRDDEDELRRTAILDLMCRMRLDLSELEQRFGRTDLAEHFADEWRALAPLAAEGFCEVDERRITVLPQGRLFLRHLAMLFDAYLSDRPAPGAQRFSQTL